MCCGTIPADFDNKLQTSLLFSQLNKEIILKPIQPPLFGPSNATLLKETVYKLACPHAGCTGKFSITGWVDGAKGDRAPTKVGPWYCKECGWASQFEIASGEKIIIDAVDKCRVPTLVLLCFDGATDDGEPLYLIVDWFAYGTSQGVMLENNGHNDYFFNEHWCPQNYLSAIVMTAKSTDPHGIFRYIEMIARPDDWEETSSNATVEEVRELFPALRANPNSRTIVAAAGAPAKLQLR